MKTNLNFSQQGLQEEKPPLSQASLRERSEAVFQESSDKLLEFIDALAPQLAKDARHHLRLQQVAFEVVNEELRRMLAAKTVDGRFALCICGGQAMSLPETNCSKSQVAKKSSVI